MFAYAAFLVSNSWLVALAFASRDSFFCRHRQHNPAHIIASSSNPPTPIPIKTLVCSPLVEGAVLAGDVVDVKIGGGGGAVVPPVEAVSSFSSTVSSVGDAAVVSFNPGAAAAAAAVVVAAAAVAVPHPKHRIGHTF
jgi:hypothetical protein